MYVFVVCLVVSYFPELLCLLQVVSRHILVINNEEVCNRFLVAVTTHFWVDYMTQILRKGWHRLTYLIESLVVLLLLLEQR